MWAKYVAYILGMVYLEFKCHDFASGFDTFLQL